MVLKRRCGLPARTAPHCLESALVLKGRCGLPARTVPPRCSEATAGFQPAPLGSTFAAQRPLQAASPRCLETALVLKVAGCQPAPLGSSCGSWAVAKAAFGAQRPRKAASPHRLETTLVLQGRCGLPARKAHRLEAALVVERRCGLLACTAPHCLEAALVLKGRCVLPARTACKQLLSSKPLRAGTAWKQLSSFRAQGPLQAAASPHRLEAALVLKRRCGLPARTAAHGLEASLVFKRRCGPAPLRSALKQVWCSNAAAGPRRSAAL